MEFQLEDPIYRQIRLMRIALKRDGYYFDEDTEARICAGDGCKVECCAYGTDEVTGLRNRASRWCSEHQPE